MNLLSDHAKVVVSTGSFHRLTSSFIFISQSPSSIRVHLRSSVVPFILILLICCSLLTGCKETTAILQSDRHPNAQIVSASLGQLSLDCASIDLNLSIDNPYSFELPVKSVSYRLVCHDTTIATGNAQTNLLIPSESTLAAPVRTNIALKHLKKECPFVTPGSLANVLALVTVELDVPAREPVVLELQHELEVPIPALPQVELVQLQWQKLTLTEAVANVELKITNSNAFSFELQKLHFTLALSGWDVAKLQFKEAVDFEPKSSNHLKMIVSFSPIAAGTALSHALHGQATQYRLYGQLEAITPLGPMKLPFDRSGTADLRKAAGVK